MRLHLFTNSMQPLALRRAICDQKNAGISPTPHVPGAEAAAGWRLPLLTAPALQPVPLADEGFGAVIP